MRQDDWVGQYLPTSWQPYARLARIDRPIGTWLLFIPCLWGVFYATPNMNNNDNIAIIIFFAVGSLVMRAAGCVWNDIIDRDLDKQVARTKTRPLANGDISVGQAVIFMVLLISGTLILAVMILPMMAILIACASVFLVVPYPLMKRITWFPQLWLGLTFNWGMLVGYVTITAIWDWQILWLYVSAIFWTLAYDTIYAHQDREDDALVGIKSTARLFQHQARLFIGGCFGLCLGCLLFLGYINQTSVLYYVLLLCALGHVIWQLWQFNKDNAPLCLRLFKANRDFGLVIALALFVG